MVIQNASGTGSVGLQLYAANTGLPLNVLGDGSGSGINTVANFANSNALGGATSNGFGLSLDLTLHSTTNDRLANQIISKWTNATDATRTSQFIITGVNNGTTGNKLVLSGTGALQLPGYGSGTFTGTATRTLQVDASGNIIEGSTNVKQLKAASIQSPTSSENVTLFYTAEAITVNSVREVITGGTSVTYSLVYSSTRTGSTTNIVSSHAASSTTGANASIANASVPAGSWVWIISTGVNGSVTEFHLTVNYHLQ
jgi:hypothetical protein